MSAVNRVTSRGAGQELRRCVLITGCYSCVSVDVQLYFKLNGVSFFVEIEIIFYITYM